MYQLTTVINTVANTNKKTQPGKPAGRGLYVKFCHKKTPHSGSTVWGCNYLEEKKLVTD